MAAGLYDITTETLGKGHFAVVKLAKHCLTGESVAIKIIDKAKLNKDGLKQLSIEINLWSRLSEHEHPNVVKLYQVIDTTKKLYLVMEYCGHDVCDLYDHIQRRNHGNGLKENESKHIFRQICSAISYCHSLKIVHRDLKPENILIITQPQEQQLHLRIKYPLVKLIDFGFSSQWAEGEMLRTSCGSLAYSAPEILLGDHYDGPKVDIWGLGCILYILLYGSNPFMQINDSETLCRILDCTFSTPPRPSISQAAIDLIKSLLKRDPISRLEIEQILVHPWFEVNDENGSDYENRENLDQISKSPLACKTIKSSVHDKVIDQMISKGLGTSRDHIEKALERARGFDAGNRTYSPTALAENSVNGERGHSNIERGHSNIHHHEHYIKATYHLLKDKLSRETGPTFMSNSNNINFNQTGQLQGKRVLPLRPRKSLLQQQRTKAEKDSILELDNGEEQYGKSFTKSDVHQLEIPIEDDAGVILPLNRKCSIVSEEGSCAAEGTGSDASGYEGPIRIYQDDFEINRPSVNIVVTDCSEINECDESEEELSLKMNDNDLANPILQDDNVKDKNTPKTSNIQPTIIQITANPVLHVVSSSPELCANENTDSDENEFSYELQSNLNSNMILSSDIKKHDKHEHFGTNKPTSTNVTSMRVITQSKSYNNIFKDNEFNGKNGDSNVSNTTLNNDQSLKRSNKTDRIDCCLIS